MSAQLDLPIAVRPPPKMPPGPIVRSAEVADGCRYVLRRAWGAGPSILWHGLNPSRADHERDDPTILREVGFSFRWGFGSMVKTNFYPFVTPKPAELWRWAGARESVEAKHRNVLKVRDEILRADVRVAAWGAGVGFDVVNEFLGMMFWDRDPLTWNLRSRSHTHDRPTRRPHPHRVRFM
jgi:hypothetical protein